jgi:hypothetical protein
MSSIHPSVGGGISPLYTPTDPAVSAPASGGPGPVGSSTPRAGAGALASRSISVGNGEARSSATSSADQAKTFFKSAGKVLAGVVLAPLAFGASGLALAGRAVMQLPRLINQHIVQPRADRQFEVANRQVLAQLRTPIEGSITQNASAMARLEQHAQDMGTPIGKDALKQLVATGEHLARGLAALAPPTPDADGMVEVSLDDTPPTPLPAGGSPLTLKLDGQPVKVESSMHTTRALAWYMMATAAAQDGARAAGPDAGAMRVPDPGNHLHSFLSAAPGAAPRMSPAVGERSDPQQPLSLTPRGQPTQRGVEDARKMLPGECGTMLFDKAPDGEGLRVRFASTGFPPYLQSEARPGEGPGVTRFFATPERRTEAVAERPAGGVPEIAIGARDELATPSEFVFVPLDDAASTPALVFTPLEEGAPPPGARFVPLDASIPSDQVEPTPAPVTSTPTRSMSPALMSRFAEVVNLGIRAGVDDSSAAEIAKGVKEHGPSFAIDTLKKMEAKAGSMGNYSLANTLQAMREDIQMGDAPRRGPTYITQNRTPNSTQPPAMSNALTARFADVVNLGIRAGVDDRSAADIARGVKDSGPSFAVDTLKRMEAKAGSQGNYGLANTLQAMREDIELAGAQAPALTPTRTPGLSSALTSRFAEVVNLAIRADVVDESAKEIAKGARQFGAPFLLDALKKMEDRAADLSQLSLKVQIQTVREEIAMATRAGRQ